MTSVKYSHSSHYNYCGAVKSGIHTDISLVYQISLGTNNSVNGLDSWPELQRQHLLWDTMVQSSVHIYILLSGFLAAVSQMLHHNWVQQTFSPNACKEKKQQKLFISTIWHFSPVHSTNFCTKSSHSYPSFMPFSSQIVN